MAKYPVFEQTHTFANGLQATSGVDARLVLAPEEIAKIEAHMALYADMHIESAREGDGEYAGEGEVTSGPIVLTYRDDASRTTAESQSGAA